MSRRYTCSQCLKDIKLLEDAILKEDIDRTTKRPHWRVRWFDNGACVDLFYKKRPHVEVR
jgi:hypothetical protein